MPVKVLIVEDDRDLALIVCQRLAQEGMQADVCETGVAALSYLAASLPDVLLCDLMLPDCPGEVVVRFVRSKSQTTPVIITSARTNPADKVDLLAMGADDYLGKPFDLDELVARIAVQLRHAAAGTAACRTDALAAARAIDLGPLHLDEASRTLAVNGTPVPLTRIEFNILLAMARRPGRVFTRPELFEAAWGEPYADDANTVNVHVSNIRNKLKPLAAGSCLATVWGVGFRLTAGAEGGEGTA